MPLGTEGSCHNCKLYGECGKPSRRICAACLGWREAGAHGVFPAGVSHPRQKFQGSQASQICHRSPQSPPCKWNHHDDALTSELSLLSHETVLWSPCRWGYVFLQFIWIIWLLWLLWSCLAPPPAFPSVHLDSSSVFRTHRFPSPALLTGSLFYNLGPEELGPMGVWRHAWFYLISWSCNICDIRLYCLSRFWPQNLHAFLIWVPTTCQLAGFCDEQKTFPIFRNLKIQQLRQILVLPQISIWL